MIGFFVGCILCWPGGFLCGGMFVAWRHRIRTPKHEHAFGAWENSQINYDDGTSASAQRRYCITCNFKEVRRCVDE